MIGLIFLALLFITGFLLSRLFFKEESFESSVVFGAALMCSLLIISVFALHTLKITSFGIRVIVIGVLIALLALNRKAFKNVKRFDKRVVFLFIPLVILGILAYYPHFTYNYPLHGDEWHHISFANKIIETGKMFTHPYEGYKVMHSESGFHAFLAGFFLFTGLDPLSHYKFLPALAAMLMGLALFVLIKQITNSVPAGIFGILLYGVLKSDTAVFGPMVLTPFMLALFVVVIIFIILFRWLHTKENIFFYAAILLLACMLTIHASLAIFTLFLIIVMLTAERVPFRKFLPHLTGVVILFFLLIFFVFSRKSFLEVSDFIKSKIFFSALGPMTTEEFFSYMALPWILLVIFGLAYLWDKKKFSLFIVSCLVFIYSGSAYWLMYSYLIRPERLFFFALVFAVIVGATGLAYIFEFFPIRFHWPILLCVFVIIFYFQSQGLFSPDFHHHISDEDREALLWIKENYHDKIILSHPFFGMAVPFSHNYAASYSPLTTLLPERESKTLELFNYAKDCEELKNFVNNSRADLVFSRKEFDCSFLEKVYDKNGFAYEVRPIPLKKAD